MSINLLILNDIISVHSVLMARLNCYYEVMELNDIDTKMTIQENNVEVNKLVDEKNCHHCKEHKCNKVVVIFADLYDLPVKPARIGGFV